MNLGRINIGSVKESPQFCGNGGWKFLFGEEGKMGKGWSIFGGIEGGFMVFKNFIF